MVGIYAHAVVAPMQDAHSAWKQAASKNKGDPVGEMELPSAANVAMTVTTGFGRTIPKPAWAKPFVGGDTLIGNRAVFFHPRKKAGLCIFRDVCEKKRSVWHGEFVLIVRAVSALITRLRLVLFTPESAPIQA
jgi:hypothetical protein